MKKKASKISPVAIQKGPINDNIPVISEMTYEEKVNERAEQLKMLHDGQRMHMMTPKQ